MRTHQFFSVAFLFVISNSVWAIKVLPITADLDLSKSRTHNISVSNKGGAQSSPVKISTFIWKLQPDGTENNEPTDELQIFPKQFYVEPEKTRVVRVSPKNTAQPDVERAYRIVVEELPVKEALVNKTGVKIVSKYVTAFYITPKNPHSKLSVKNVARLSDGFQLHVANEGNAHTHLINPSVTFKQGSSTVTISEPKQLNGLAGENLHAKSERQLRWAWPKDLAKSINLSAPYEVEVTFECEFCEVIKDKLIFQVK